jgi:hypothetical protein
MSWDTKRIFRGMLLVASRLLLLDFLLIVLVVVLVVDLWVVDAGRGEEDRLDLFFLLAGESIMSPPPTLRLLEHE